MKFALQSVLKGNGRIGVISEIGRLPNTTLETPLLLLYTKGGSVPHLTHEVLQMVTAEPVGFQIPLSTTSHCHESVSNFKKGFAEFSGIKESLTYCSVQDPATETLTGYNGKKTVSIWSRRGKEVLDPEKFMDIIEAFKPDMYHNLCDGDTSKNSTAKRLQKSVERTHEYFEYCFDRHKKSDKLKSSALLAVIEGGFSPDERKRSAEKVANSDVIGYLIDGLHNNGPDVETTSFDDIKDIVGKTLTYLRADRLRFVHGGFSPAAVLELVELGIDVFDSTYPYLVTERNAAITFGRPNNEISLVDEKYREYLKPISSECTCLTCRQHTCAYIHHLVNVKELLAPVLLMIHNLHQYLEFFKNIRTALRNGTMDELKKTLTRLE